MKKIVFLRINPSATGGAERYLLRLVKALKNENIQSEIRSFNSSTKMPSWKKALRFNRQVKLQKKDNELYFSLERIECADIYRAGDGVHRVYMRTKRFWWTNPLNFIIPKLEKKCFQNAKAIIANSNFVKEQIIQTYGIDEAKIYIIYNGVNLPQNIEKGTAKMALCEELSLDYELPIILFVGNGFKRKGVTDFLQILSKVKAQFNAIVVGNDKNLQHYRNLSRKLGVNAIFTGITNNVAKFYEASEILFFPTHYEPFSNVTLEAMSFKNAVITTAQNGAAEILSQNFVMNSPNDENIIPVIEKLLNDSFFLQNTMEHNFQIASKFSIELNAKKTLEVINANLY